MPNRLILKADFGIRFPGNPEFHFRLEEDLAADPIQILLGASGSGKSTLLRCLAGLERPLTGGIEFAGESWFESGTGRQLPPQRRRIGFLTQGYGLFPHLDVTANISFGLHGGFRALQPAQARDRVALLIELLELGGLERRHPSRLSGGEQQRVALARALAPNPGLLLLDEPLSALDPVTRTQLRAKLREWLRRFAVPAIIVTHDLDDARAMGDRLHILLEGRIVQSGKVSEVLNAPCTTSVAAFLGVENILPGIHFGRAGSGFACIRAENIEVLAMEDASVAGAFEGVVQEIIGEGRGARLLLDCGFPLVAWLPPGSRQPRAGMPVRALVRPGGTLWVGGKPG